MLTLLASLLLAHPGGVDVEGCHRDTATGDRHCHVSGVQTSQTTGTVIRVSDGDTIRVRMPQQDASVRLACIAPRN